MPIRPDIVLSKATSTYRGILSSGKVIDVMLECKENPSTNG